jgi:hypothetical protein
MVVPLPVPMAAGITKYLNKYVRRGICLIYMSSFYFWSPPLARKMRKTNGRKLSHNGCTAAILTYPTMVFYFWIPPQVIWNALWGIVIKQRLWQTFWSITHVDQNSEVKNHGRVGQNCGCTTIMAQFSSTSGLQDSLTYMYYISKCLCMSLLYKYIQ